MRGNNVLLFNEFFSQSDSFNHVHNWKNTSGLSDLILLQTIKHVFPNVSFMSIKHFSHNLRLTNALMMSKSRSGTFLSNGVAEKRLRSTKVKLGSDKYLTNLKTPRSKKSNFEEV